MDRPSSTISLVPAGKFNDTSEEDGVCSTSPEEGSIIIVQAGTTGCPFIEPVTVVLAPHWRRRSNIVESSSVVSHDVVSRLPELFPYVCSVRCLKPANL